LADLLLPGGCGNLPAQRHQIGFEVAFRFELRQDFESELMIPLFESSLRTVDSGPDTRGIEHLDRLATRRLSKAIRKLAGG